MDRTISIVGGDAHLASPKELAAGIQAAQGVFAKNNVDPLDCAAASDKRERGEPLSREEALLCVIWDRADDAAWRAATLGWLSRDIDIGIAVAPQTESA
jgi:hypothetical protein